MKRHGFTAIPVLLLCVAALLSSARPALAQISVDTAHIACGEQQSGDTDNYPLPPTGTGETLIYVANMLHDVTSIVNSFGGGGNEGDWVNPCTWSEVPNAYSNGLAAPNYGSSTIWVCPNARSTGTASTNAFVTGTSGDTFLGGCMVPVTGLAAAPIDQASNNQITASVTTLVTPSITGQTLPEFFIAVSNCENTGNAIAAEGGVTFIAGGAMAANGAGGCPTGYYISSAAGSYAAGLVQSPAGGGNTSIASFKAAGAVSPPPPKTGTGVFFQELR
ncbi:MAG: hypothetical protein ACYDC3_09085 [Candidatus Binataceae bacterium]